MARPTTVHHCANGAEYVPGSFESCTRCNPPTREGMARELEYYLERQPTCDEITAALDWVIDNPQGNLAEYVEAVQAL